MSTRTGNTPTPPLLSESGRSSPPPSCVICLGPFENRSFTENCLHQFCFDCLLRWSKIKAECPLCKQPFKSIIHSVRSNHLYDKYDVPQTQSSDDMDMAAEFTIMARRFRYRTTLTIHPRNNNAIRSLLFGFPTDSLPVDNIYARYRNTSSSDYSLNRYNNYNTLFRRTVYHRNMWANPLPDVTGRFRECTPEFYRNNPAQLHRLVPWLNRELISLCLQSSTIAYILNQFTEILTLRPIKSRAFRSFVASIIPSHEADHFIHEFYSFAISPYDMVGYDRAVSYRSGGPYVIDNTINEISSSEDNSNDSDVFVVTSEAGPSNLVNRSHSTDTTNQVNSSCLGGPIVIESISHSDTDDSSEGVLMIVDKKPEIVDLVGSDSDAVIVEEQKPVVSENADTTESQSLPIMSLPSTSGYNLMRINDKPIFLSDTDSDYSFVSAKKVRMKSNIFKRRKNMKCTCASAENTDQESDSSSGSSSSSNSNFSHTGSSRSKSIDNRFDLSQNLNTKVKHTSSLKDKQENTSTVINYKNKRGRSSSIDSQHSNIIKKQKRKKIKHKKSSKRKSDSSKRKHKHKQRRRSNSREKSYSNSFPLKNKGKSCSKSKVKNKRDSISSISSDDSKSTSYRRKNTIENVDNLQLTDKKKTLKSVVNLAKNSDKTNLLDLMNDAVLSSNNSILSINNKHLQCNQEISKTIKYENNLNNTYDIHEYIEDSKAQFSSAFRNGQGEPLDLRKKDDANNLS